MTRAWQPNGSNAEFWRSDNPLIQGWWRFGDTPPPTWMTAGTANPHLSGMMIDTGPQKRYLRPYYNTSDANTIVPVQGIAPWATSGSGIQFRWNNALENERRSALYIDPAHTLEGTTASVGSAPGAQTAASMGQLQGLGYIGALSGMTLIGWVRIPRVLSGSLATDTNGRRIFGRGGNAGSLRYFGLYWAQLGVNGPYQIQALGRANFGNTILPTVSEFYDAVLRSDTSPHFPTNRDEPFFVAMQIRRENPTSNRHLGLTRCSGQISVFIGNAASGIVASRTTTITPQTTNIAITDALAGLYIGAGYTVNGSAGFGGDPYANTSAATNRSYVPSGTILDEFVYVSDGYLDNDRIAYYALSGMQYIPESDPASTSFQPQYPGTDELVAYWSFDNGNGNNTAPATINDPRLYFSLSGTTTGVPHITFINGVRGGSGIRVQQRFASMDLTGELSAPYNAATQIAQNRLHGVEASSGLQYLFPSGSMDEGMTWIGWVKHRTPAAGNSDNSPAAIGWIGTSGYHTMFCINGSRSTSLYSQFELSYQASGVFPFADGTLKRTDGRHYTRTIQNGTLNITMPPGSNGKTLTLSPSGSAAYRPLYDRGDDDWHLWAIQWDNKANQVLIVRDAYYVIQISQTPPSGFASDGLGRLGGMWTLTNTIPTYHTDFDDWAVYRRLLTIPEMSGYALLGIRRPAPDAYLSTPMPSLVGYWPMESITTYGSLSGQRVDDESWYRHHLTNISGTFNTRSALNPEFTDVTTSLQVTTSGSMLNLSRQSHGANLDMSMSSVYSLSGMSAGAWLYVPSGNGSSGLYGDHMIMGCWDQDENLSSWFMGIRDNKFHLKFRAYNPTTQISFTREFASSHTIPFNSPFFVAFNVAPSGYFTNGFDTEMAVEMCYAEASETGNVTYVISNNTSWLYPDDVFNSCGPSGFSILNAPNLDYGFPSGTAIGEVFVHLGALSSGQLIATKRSGIRNVTLASGSVASNDGTCISHWKMNTTEIPSLDSGPEQNTLTLFNTDAEPVQVVPAIHGSGIYLREQDYLDTIPFNTSSRRLDLGSGNQSWTFLGWVYTPETISSSDRKFIMNKGGSDEPTTSGIQIYTPTDSLQLIADASGVITYGFNGELEPGTWNHIAIIYNRDYGKFISAINGRYAGLTQVRTLGGIPVNASGMTLGGRGDESFNTILGGGGFSGILDDVMIFGRALTLPEISGLAGNSYNFNERPFAPVTGYVGGYISGIEAVLVSGLFASFMHGINQEVFHFGGYVDAVSGMIDHAGGYIYGAGQSSGVVGSFLHGANTISGIYAGFLHGLGLASGVIGVYTLGAEEGSAEFDVTFNFQIVAAKDFDSRLEIAKTSYQNFDALLGVYRITTPPACLIQVPEVGFIASGTPYTLTVQGSGWAYDDKSLSKVRFTFADFKGGANGQLVGGMANSGLYQATRVFDTPGWYTVKMEVVDSYGYRGSHCRPFLLVPSGSTSGAYLATLPLVAISGTPVDGVTIHRAFFTHSISGLSNTSGILEYTDFADQQESLLNSSEMPSGTQFIDFVRTHEYTMPGQYSPVWAVSGAWGVVSDSLSANSDHAS